MSGWHRWLFVSNDGQHVATGYEGLNLIPLDYSPDMVLITFWEQGKKLRSVSLKDVVPNKAVLERTVSHYHWGTIDGVNERNQLVVTRADGVKVRFEMSTGAKQ